MCPPSLLLFVASCPGAGCWVWRGRACSELGILGPEHWWSNKKQRSEHQLVAPASQVTRYCPFHAHLSPQAINQTWPGRRRHPRGSVGQRQGRMMADNSTGAEHAVDDCLGVSASPPSTLGPTTPSKPGSCTAQDGSCELHRLRRPLWVAAGASLAERAPEVAARLDVALSGFSAAQISVGSSTDLGA